MNEFSNINMDYKHKHINIIYLSPISSAIIISELQPLTGVVSVENDSSRSLAGGELSTWVNHFILQLERF